MLVLVTFVGWVVLRFAATYMDGEAGRAVSPAGSVPRSPP
jgi:NADH:ubiquinone oxidoreductase subunit 5 (subunit L)/multisubunit Na+/H+ antiporter MnhA subunit